MIRLGKHVTQAGDQLYDVAIDKVFKALINPNGEVAGLQRKLQAIRAMDASQYRKLKIQLPYVVCAQFHPKVRRKENFLYADRFLIDIDHLSEYGLEMETMKAIFGNDPRVELMFASPSGDGLKLLFRLSEKITDPNYYVVFYKAFCLGLEKQYRLGAALDHKTHDVSRCCFVSFDPEAYYNPEASGVSPAEFAHPESLWEMDQIQQEATKIHKEHQQEVKAKSLHAEDKSQPGQDLPDDVLAFIKEKIGQKVKQVRQKDYEQPEELKTVMAQMEEYLKEINASIEQLKPISYGRQVRITTGKAWAEVNVFFGRRGVSIVATTKSGSHKELGKTITEFLRASFQEI
jgi:hypothetical protein